MKRFHALILLVLASGTLAAQTEFQFSLPQAIEYALKNQNDVLNAQLDNTIAHYKVKETVGLGLPQISASFDIKDFFEIPTTLIPAAFMDTAAGGEEAFIPVKFGTQWQAMGGINASQLVFDPVYLLGVKATQTYRDLSQKNYSRTRIETAVSVTKAYYNLLVLQEVKPVYEANLARVKKLRDDTKALYQNGFVEKIDVDRLEVALNNVISEKEKFDRNLDFAYSLLKFQMGMPVKSNLVITDSLNTEAIKNLSPVTDNFDIKKRVEYSLLQTEHVLWDYNVKRYKQAGIPKLYLYANLSYSGYANSFDIFDPEKKWYPTGLVGATLSFPIFDGRSRHARVIQTKAELDKISNRMKQFENSAVLEIESSRNEMLNAVTAVTLQEKNLKLATDVARTSKIKYDQGVGSNLEILDAETSLKEAQSNYYRAIFDALIAKVNLDKALGNLTY